MASFHHQAFFKSESTSEYFDDVKNDTVVTRIKVLFVTIDLETNKKVETPYYIDIPPPGDNFIPYKLVDHHILRKWASMYGDAIYYQDVNVEKLHDSVETKENCNIPHA